MKTPNLDSVTTINSDGSHHILHPSDVRGSFTLRRRLIAYFLLAVYAALPWIPINGHPAVFFDIVNRRFHFMGLTLVPQDLWVLFFLISGLGFVLFFLTALLGRVWCGYACPYTLFLEHLYRRVERFIDGDGPARRRLANAPWDARKIRLRLIKWTLYGLLSLALSHLFISYFVSIPRLYQYILQGPQEHLVTFAFVAGLTVIFYFCFVWFREQFCILMCPYGRIQSALTDDDTIIVGYDNQRGEPRGKKNATDRGDCINCRRCVNVCPTGIDIRNGLQLECIGCAQCIDACHEIMLKVGQPTGLIRYDSLNGLLKKKRRLLRPRIFVYLALGLLGLTVLSSVAFFKASPVMATATRMRGAPWYFDGTNIRNNYEVRLLNKRQQPVTFQVALDPPLPGITLSPSPEHTVILQPQAETKRPLIISYPSEHYQGPHEIRLRITAQPGNHQIVERVRFLGPPPSQLTPNSSQ